MVVDLAAAARSIPRAWQTSRWVLPVAVVALNTVAVVGVNHVTASSVSPLRTTHAPIVDQVLGDRADRTTGVEPMVARCEAGAPVELLAEAPTTAPTIEGCASRP